MRQIAMAWPLWCVLPAWLAACSSNAANSAPNGDKARLEGDAGYYTCRYENPFSHVAECREYRGQAFDAAEAKKACAKPFTSVTGRLSRAACPSAGAIGSCTEGDGTERMAVTLMYGGFRSIYKAACENFARGLWSDESKVPERKVPNGLMPEARAALVSDAAVDVAPEALDDAGLEALISARRAIWFVPRAGTTADGLILYPGAAVDPRAYAPLARAVAAEGYVVGIVPMPGLLALAGIERARDAMAERTQVTRWTLAGHSLGGTMAARFVAHDAQRTKVSGLALLGAFADVNDDLHTSQLPVLSIYGSEDGRATEAEVDAARSLLPTSARYVRLRGANHAQFGWYGIQEGDRPAQIDRKAQQALIAASLVHFMRSLAAPTDSDARFVRAAAFDRTLCRDAQLHLARMQGLLPEQVKSEELIGSKEFGTAKSRVEPGAPGTVHNVEHVIEQGQSGLLGAPPVMPRELWCKLKNQGALTATLKLNASGPEASCADLNQHTVDWALGQLTPAERARLTPERKLVPIADQEYATGIEWLTQGGLEIAAGAGALPRSVRSASLRVAADADVAEQFRGVHYCKLLAGSEALRLLLLP